MVLIQKGLTLLLSVILIKLLSTVNAVNVVIGSKQYYIGTDQQVNWYTAAQLCASRGMSLASIDSESDQKTLESYLNTKSILDQLYWLSGNNLVSGTTTYQWLATGGAISYKNWDTSEPTAANPCVATVDTLKWKAEDCATNHNYICSKPLLPLCGVNNQCYYTYSYYNN